MIRKHGYILQVWDESKHPNHELVWETEVSLFGLVRPVANSLLWNHPGCYVQVVSGNWKQTILGIFVRIA